MSSARLFLPVILISALVGQTTQPALAPGRAFSAGADVNQAAGQQGPRSIVYIKAGNVWITNPSASNRHAVTSDGPYTSPSIAADGTIGALQSAGGTVYLVRMDSTGNILSRIPTSLRGGGKVVRAKLSPDGQVFGILFASLCYRTTLSAGRMAESERCGLIAYTPSSSWKLSDPTSVQSRRDYTDLAWVDNDRLIASVRDWCVDSFVLGAGGLSIVDGMRFCLNTDVAQPSFQFYSAAVSPNGRVAAVVFRLRSIASFDAQGNPLYGPPQLCIFPTGGAPRTGPPVAIPVNGAPFSPTFSPDGSRIAFSDNGGLKVYSRADKQITVLDAEGRGPSWQPRK